jgi:autotransporter translocation and assembly factor TamB
MLALTGRMTSGPGQLALAGQADLEASTVDLALTGDRFEIYDTPDAQALLSPDLQIAWRDHTLKLRGQVTIPQADITPKIRFGPGAQGGTEPAQAIPGEVIVPSPDVVVVSDTLQIAPDDTVPAAPFRIDSRLRVQMGEKVRIQAVGLVSRIAGAVDFTNTPEQASLIPLARGRFSLEEGTFRAFGQDLEIETGQLIFADVPATEPEINLRAVRWIDNDPQVTAAGVQVTGPFAEPTLELFSRPQLDTSEIQSYLLTGRSPRSRENVLGIGTYVSRKVYVGYGFNMLERTSEFNSLFNISPRYGVGSSVGEADNNINLTITYEH